MVLRQGLFVFRVMMACAWLMVGRCFLTLQSMVVLPLVSPCLGYLAFSVVHGSRGFGGWDEWLVGSLACVDVIDTFNGVFTCLAVVMACDHLFSFYLCLLMEVVGCNLLLIAARVISSMLQQIFGVLEIFLYGKSLGCDVRVFSLF